MVKVDPLQRYSRQMLVPQIGREGQEKLSTARVGLIGCGALGSFISIHLVRAGIGFVRIVDKDQPELHNLHRQVLFTEEDVARRISKAEAAAIHLREANSRVTVEPVVASVGGDNLPELASDLDILVDGTDNFATRFVINEYAVGRCMPWVYGGVIRSSGMSMTIVPGDGPCLRCLIHELPGPEQSPTADVAGVLSTAVAVVAAIEANEVIKLIVDPAARNRHLMMVDVWDLKLDRLEVPRDPDCISCGGVREAACL